MKYLIDTHAFIWYLKGEKKLSDKSRSILEDISNEIFISNVSFWEIAIKTSIGKLELNSTLVELQDFAIHHGFKLLNFTNDDLDIMVELPFHHQDPFDRLIIAQSIGCDLKMISDDNKFEAYPIDLVEG